VGIGNRRGRRRLFVTGIGAFTAASAACAPAPDAQPAPVPVPAASVAAGGR
jgi:MFS family permease